MKDFLYSIIITFSFFTIIPLPMVNWTSKRMRFLPLLMPFVGLGIGLLGYGIYSLLINLAVSAVAMVLFYLVITGGLHMDGLMDTADAYFSRQTKEKKMEIMKDSRVGAFAVMALVCLLLIKISLFYEIFRAGGGTGILLIMIPILSRTVQALMLCHFPFAKEDGLAVMYSQATGQKTSLLLTIYFVLTSGIIYLLFNMTALLLPLGLLTFTVYYYFSVKKNFGGITGDIVGTYVELAEVLMLGLLLVL